MYVLTGLECTWPTARYGTNREHLNTGLDLTAGVRCGGTINHFGLKRNQTLSLCFKRILLSHVGRTNSTIYE